MSIDALDRIVVGDGDVPGSDADELALLLVGLVDGQVALTLASLQQQPQVGEGGQTRTGDIAQVRTLQVGDEEVGDHQPQQDERGALGRHQHGGEWGAECTSTM